VTDHQPYPVTEEKDILIPTRDGTRLAANLYLPEGAGPVPAIVVYFPYLKDGPSGRGPIHAWQTHFAQRGYAGLTVDARGFGGSEGVAAPPNSLQEKEDGRDALDWIAAQPWCNGVTGMWGISYSGSSSLAAASLQPPSLKAIVPMHATPDEYLGVFWPRGSRQAWWTENSWGARQLAYQLLPPLHRDLDRRWARVWHERLEHLEPWPFTWHTTDPETYVGWQADVRKITAATYAVSAWHDYYPLETLAYYNAIDAPKRALVGPWKHEFPDLATNHPIDHRSEMDRWWDRWLKGIKNGVEDEPPVLVWHQGGEGWVGAADWRPRGSAEEVLYVGPAGTLQLQPPSEAGSDRHVVDPTVGIDLLPWDPQAPIVPMPFDRSGDDHRALTYTTDPLPRPLDLRGDPEVTVVFRADQPEFPLAAWLADVWPDGKSTLICQGWASPSHATGAPLERERDYAIVIPLYSTSYRVPAGHRLRLGISGSHFPLLWPSPRVPTLTILRSPGQAMRVRLPLAPTNEATPGPRPNPPAPNLVTSIPGQIHELNVVRPLVGGWANVHRHDVTTHRLADGSVLHVDLGNDSKVFAANPGDTALTGHAILTLDHPTEPVVVTVHALQTFDHYHLTGRIDIAGKRFFERSWDLDL
jgi:putative CocE/NonD family hydrolase